MSDLDDLIEMLPLKRASDLLTEDHAQDAVRDPKPPKRTHKQPSKRKRETVAVEKDGASGRCPMQAPRGTVCKTCGKVHPL